MKPLVSVVLPSYNHELYIGEAIDSVLGQTFQDFELLISDDCSQDRTMEVIRRYNDRRVKVHRFNENMGATINHRYLLEQASGEYIALINSDDVWCENRLEKQINYLLEHKECGACFSWADFIDENGAPIDMGSNIFNQPNRTQAQWLKHFFTSGNCICHPSVLIRKSVYDKAGYYNLSLRQLPDFDMWVRVVKHFPIHIIQEPLVKHRRFIKSGENTSSPKLSNSIRDVMESFHILTQFFEDLDDVLFKEAFKDMFRSKNANTHAELLCEKFFLMLDGKYYMPQVPYLAAIEFLFKVYNEEKVAETLLRKYDFSLKDFHNISCKIDLLDLLPKDMSVDSQCNFDVEAYLKANKLRSLALTLFDKNSRIYKILKSLYSKFRRI